MEKYFENYYKLREMMYEAEVKEEWTRYLELKNEYLLLCRVILDNLMENNSDVLKRLKKG